MADHLDPNRGSRSSRWRTVLLAAGGMAAFGLESPAFAGPFTGTISDFWNAPVPSGNVVDAATLAKSPLDNTATAVCNLGCAIALAVPAPPAGTVTVAWGNGSFPLPTSVLSFTLATTTFNNQPVNTPFQVGTFSYTNGTSDLGTLIFGATLHLVVNDLVGGTHQSTDIPFNIITTSNTGNAAQNTDVVQFPATSTTLPGTSMNVLEGATASFILTGEIVGDPTLDLLQLTIAPGSEDSGFVGNGVYVPEPATLGLLGVGFASVSLVRRGRRA